MQISKIITKQPWTQGVSQSLGQFNQNALQIFQAIANIKAHKEKMKQDSIGNTIKLGSEWGWTPELSKALEDQTGLKLQQSQDEAPPVITEPDLPDLDVDEKKMLGPHLSWNDFYKNADAVMPKFTTPKEHARWIQDTFKSYQDYQKNYIKNVQDIRINKTKMEKEQAFSKEQQQRGFTQEEKKTEKQQTFQKEQQGRGFKQAKELQGKSLASKQPTSIEFKWNKSKAALIQEGKKSPTDAEIAAKMNKMFPGAFNMLGSLLEGGAGIGEGGGGNLVYDPNTGTFK